MSEHVTFSILLKPGAKRDAILDITESTISICITSPPIDGKANDHLIRFLAKILDVSKSSIQILHGKKSKRKVIKISGKDKIACTKLIEENIKHK